MKKLKGYWKIISLIVIFHMLQAFATNTLPRYTSVMIDVGIQNSGFEYVVPYEVTNETYQTLSHIMLPNELAEWENKYSKTPKGTYQLNSQVKDNKEELKRLDSIFQEPFAMYETMRQEKSEFLSKVKEERQTQESIKNIRQDVIPLLQAQGEDYVHNRAVRVAVDEYEATGHDISEVQKKFMFKNGFKMFGLAILTISSAIVAFYIASKLGASIGYELRGTLYKKILSFSDHEMSQFTTASLITRSTNDIQQVQQTLSIFLRGALSAIILAIGAVIQIMITQIDLSWIIALGVAVIFIIIGTLFALMLPKFRLMQKQFDKVNAIAREVLTGIQVIRAFGRQKYENKRFDDANVDLKETHLFADRTMTIMMPLMLMTANVVSVVIVYVGSDRILNGQLAVGEMMAFISYSMQVIFSFLQLSMMSLMLPRAIVSMDRIREVIETPLTIEDPVEPVKIESPKGLVSFNDVTFQYDDAEAPTLCHISFIAEPGKTTAIIGSTGSGKSTILNLLMRFNDVTEGSITIDGVDIRDMTQHDLHELIGFVPQKGILFYGTIRSNIDFSKNELSDEEMIRAAEIAHASEFIEQKDHGYDDPIGQGGSNVSGGQRQRLSIARAIAKDPEIYVFDDSFSALDYRTDASLRKALNENVEDATVIIVAQRISTILDADQIIVLNEGKIDGIGRHEELLQTSNVYKEIAQSQLSEKELAQYNGINLNNQERKDKEG